MYYNIFFFILLRYFSHNKFIILNFLNYKINIDLILKKKIIALFLHLKKKIEYDMFFLNKKKNYLTTLHLSIKTLRQKKKNMLNLTDKTSYINFNNKILNLKLIKIFLNNYYYLYLLFFNFISFQSKIFFNKFFYFYFKKKNEKFSFLNFFILKKNFLKISYLMVNLLHLNYSPFILTNKGFNNILLSLNNYLKFTNTNINNLKYGFIFCTSPLIQLKQIFEAKKKKIPLISVADLNTNLN